MEKILKYKSWFLAIGIIITFTFSQRFLNNPWAEYAGETLVAIGLNMEFISDKRQTGKIGLARGCGIFRDSVRAVVIA